jgi:hypothetical protein
MADNEIGARLRNALNPYHQADGDQFGWARLMILMISPMAKDRIAAIARES